MERQLPGIKNHVPVRKECRHALYVSIQTWNTLIATNLISQHWVGGRDGIQDEVIAYLYVYKVQW